MYEWGSNLLPNAGSAQAVAPGMTRLWLMTRKKGTACALPF